MKFFSQTLAVLFSLALLGVLGVGGYFALRFIAELVAKIDPQVAAVTVIASVVPLLAAKIISRSIRQAIQQNKGNQLYAEKAVTYQCFIDVWEDLLRYGHNTEDRRPNESPEELLALDRHLMLYGSSGVIKAYAELRALERESGQQHPHVRAQLTMVLLEMRKDLDLGTLDLTAEELQRLLFVNSDMVSTSPRAAAYHDLQPLVSLAPNS